MRFQIVIFRHCFLSDSENSVHQFYIVSEFALLQYCIDLLINQARFLDFRIDKHNFQPSFLQTDLNKI